MCVFRSFISHWCYFGAFPTTSYSVETVRTIIWIGPISSRHTIAGQLFFFLSDAVSFWTKIRAWLFLHSFAFWRIWRENQLKFYSIFWDLFETFSSKFIFSPLLTFARKLLKLTLFILFEFCSNLSHDDVESRLSLPDAILGRGHLQANFGSEYYT